MVVRCAWVSGSGCVRIGRASYSNFGHAAIVLALLAGTMAAWPKFVIMMISLPWVTPDTFQRHGPRRCSAWLDIEANWRGVFVKYACTWGPGSSSPPSSACGLDITHERIISRA